MEIGELLEKIRYGNLNKHRNLVQVLLDESRFPHILKDNVTHQKKNHWNVYSQNDQTTNQQLGIYDKRNYPRIVLDQNETENFESILHTFEKDVMDSNLNAFPKTPQPFEYIGYGMMISSIFLMGSSLFPESYYPDLKKIGPLGPFLFGLLGGSITFFSEEIRDSLQDIVDHYQSRNIPKKAYDFLFDDDAIDQISPFIKEKYHSLLENRIYHTT